jgi:hypothetical protein
MQNNDIETRDILAGFILAVLAAGIILGLWKGISAVQDAVRVDSRPTIPVEYQDDYRAAEALRAEWIYKAVPKYRKAEIRTWLYEEFKVPLPVVREHNFFLEDFIAERRKEYMFANRIYDIDPLLAGVKYKSF